MTTHAFDFRLEQVEEAQNSDNVEISLQADNVWDWVQKYRPNVGGTLRNFDLIPFWKLFYQDPHTSKGALCGRQVYKSTTATDLLSYVVTGGPFRNAMYVIHDPTALESFSTERIREGTFLANPLLVKFLPYSKRAAVKTIKLTNYSRLSFRHSQRHYANTEGQTSDILILDEIQKQDLTKLKVAKHTIRVKRGSLIMFGIGAEEGSTFHDMLMQESDIYDWVYDDKSDYVDKITKKVWTNQGWRHKLTFDEFGGITNTSQELQKILSGKLQLIHKATNDQLYKFYHFPQEIFAEIPLTISDTKRYYRAIDDSIEYQQIHDSNDLYQAHCKGWFYTARGRPLTLSMIRACYDDHISFLTPNEIKVLKEKYKNTLIVTAGIDWGSNKKDKSYTVFMVLLCFKKTQFIPAHYQIAYFKKFDIERSDAEEALDIIKLIKLYHVDNTTADLGFGKSGVKILQDGLPELGIKGISRSRVHGVFTLGNLLEETHSYQIDVEMEGVKNAYLKVHKTERIDALIGIIKATIPNSTDPTNKDRSKPKLIIPHQNPLEVDTLEQGLLKIQREDLIESTTTDIDKRQRPEKKYLHYKDEVSALIHAFIAFDNYDPGAYTIRPIRNK